MPDMLEGMDLEEARSGPSRSPPPRQASVAATAAAGAEPPSPLDHAHRQRDPRLRTLFDAHYDFVWRSLRGLGVAPGQLDDGAQQVFLLGFRKLDAITPGSERPFLFRLATGVAANLRRTVRRKREVGDDAVLEARPDTAADPEELVSRGEAQRLLDEALSWMPGDLRMVFVLFELEEMEIPDIAASLEIPVGTVGSRLRRAREKFKEAAQRVQRREGRYR